MQFMERKRILYVSQEIHPYLPENNLSKPSLELPKRMNEQGHEVRVFMPRYGLINERRHQLHEVIRLSGINIIVNDMDQPLIIKVASVPSARMQVYFIDNEEYFKRKAIFTDDKGEFFNDNDQRAIFFCRGVVETVKKLGWSPDIIHCHGWMASVLPLYLKKFHADDPLFADTKIVLSVYSGTQHKMPESLSNTLKFDGIEGEDLERYNNADVNSMYQAGSHYVNGVVIADEDIEEKLQEYLRTNVTNLVEGITTDNHADLVKELYEQILVEETVA